MHHVRIRVAVRVMAVPAELPAAGGGAVLRPVMGRVDFLGAVLQRGVNGDTGRTSCMAALAVAVLAPGRISEVLQSEGICRGLVRHGVVVAVETLIGNGEPGGGVA